MADTKNVADTKNAADTTSVAKTTEPSTEEQSATTVATSSAVETTVVPPALPKSSPPSKAIVEDDSSEDEFDELDDMLDEFDDGKPANGGGVQGDVLDENWARMLQEGMADLLNDVNESPEMQGQFEKLAKELDDAMASTSANETMDSGPSSAPAVATDPAAVNFQDRIKQTMERMKSSNAEVDAGLAEPDNDDFLAEMLKSMGGTSEGGEEDFSNMLVNMMEQLTSKEILYEPMKELYEKYPEWIRKNEAKESKENMTRYREQFSIVKDVVLKFDEPNYKDENEADREYIVERMQKMQSAGAPPQELMGDMGQGLEPPDIGSDCAVQ